MPDRPERPLVLLGKLEDAEKKGKPVYFSPPHFPSYTRQIERLSPKFQELQSVLDRGAITIQETPDGIDPEYTLILEANIDQESLYTAVRGLQRSYNDFELLFEIDNEDVPPDDDFYYIKNGTRDINQKLTFKCFCVLANHRALQEILSLWKNYCKNPNYDFPHGKKKLKDIFNKLKDIRQWSIKERFEDTGARKAWEDDLADSELENLKCEIELSYRQNIQKGAIAEERVKNEIIFLGGKVLKTSCISEIGYHAILAEIPKQKAEDMLQNTDISFLGFNEILFVNPCGQSSVTASDEAINFEDKLQFPDSVNDEPILALFDGLPQENHPLLKDFLYIDDPDDYTSFYKIKDRQHGTGMASLITWGELSNNPTAINRKIYVRPIMKPHPSPNGTTEYVPDDVLLVDKIHSAIKRLFEPQDGNSISTIKIINLSIGINNRPFYFNISPLAKLLDWLSFKYKILFIVSAGNYCDDIDIGMNYSEFSKLQEQEKDKIIIKVINNRSHNQRLLSPAESINSLTIGSLFSDNSNYIQKGNEILPCSNNIPALYSANGRGVNHSIKPDLLLEGGRNTVNEDYIHKNIAHWGVNPRTIPPGILHAKPTSPTIDKSVGYSFGTSNSAAILSHNAIKCYDVLNDVFNEETENGIPSEYASLLLKTMLVHGAKWGDIAPFIGNNLGMLNRGEYYDKIHKYLGYGVPDIEKVKECTQSRITLIGYGDLAKEKAHIYTLPIPFNFSTKIIFRELTVSMAYFTPIVPNTKKYKQAHLWFSLEENKGLLPNRSDAHHDAVKRGTLQHEHFYGNDLVSWSLNDTVKIKVNCRKNYIGLTDSIPYSIFITFEVAPEYNMDVYADILARVKPKVDIDTRIRG